MNKRIVEVAFTDNEHYLTSEKTYYCYDGTEKGLSVGDWILYIIKVYIIKQMIFIIKNLNQKIKML